MSGEPDSPWQWVRSVTPRTGRGCEDCLRTGSNRVHLRLCLTSGHVGCCDASPLKHARGHAQEAGQHPIAASLEPGEDRRWCFLREALV